VNSLQSLAFARGVTQCVGTPAELRELSAAGEAAAGDVPGRLVLGPGGVSILFRPWERPRSSCGATGSL